VGFTFKPELAAILAVCNGAAVTLSYIASQGNVTATMVSLAISAGIAAGVSYYEEKEKANKLS
jgi:hypothetical protein